VVRNPAGATLLDVEPERVTDAVLDDAWANLAQLHARIARQPVGGQRRGRRHRRDGARRPRRRRRSATDGRLRLDRVQLLATSAELVGEDRALAAAHRALSADDLVDVLAFLEPPALTGAAKRHITTPKALLAGLRDAGAALTGVEPPKPAELHRFSARCWRRVALGIYLLAQLAGVAAMGDIFRGDLGGSCSPVIAQLLALRRWPCSARCRRLVRSRHRVQFAQRVTELVGARPATPRWSSGSSRGRACGDGRQLGI
jgi:hypothetical protein